MNGKSNNNGACERVAGGSAFIGLHVFARFVCVHKNKNSMELKKGSIVMNNDDDVDDDDNEDAMVYNKRWGPSSSRKAGLSSLWESTIDHP